MDLKAAIRPTAERVDALTLRERILLFAAALALVYTAIVVGLIHPLMRREHAIAMRLTVVHAQTAKVDRALNRVLAPTLRGHERAALKRLKGQVGALKGALTTLAAGLVPARAMPALMRRVLAQAPGVMTLALQNAPAIAIRGRGHHVPLLYRHEMTVTVRGRYAALVHYLTLLATLRQRLLWGPVALTANRYPYSTLTVHIYTLSTRRAWLQ